MKTVTFNDIKQLAFELADRPRADIPPTEATMFLAFCAAELPDLWNKEAWPELCANVESVGVTNGVFGKREGDADEIGDVLGVFDSDPRSSSKGFNTLEFVEEDDQVRCLTSSADVWVDWQLPAPDLLSIAADQLAATTLPARFKLPLAFRGAAHLLAPEDPGRAGQYRAMAEVELSRQASRLQRPWWRKPSPKL